MRTKGWGSRESSPPQLHSFQQGLESVGLQCLIQTLTKHFGCVFEEGIWGAALIFCFASLFGLASLNL